MLTSSPESSSKQMLRLSIDLRWVVALLLAAIVAMFFIWKPWATVSPTARTIQVTGDATIKAVPDEFVFYPMYQSKSTDKATAIKELTARSDEVVAGLKKVGVPDSGIKTNASSYDYYSIYNDNSGEVSYTLELTVTVGNQALAQKVQDYLLTTAPTGSVTPQANFSEAKRKELESTARDQATKDARAKADQMGKNLGFKLGKVKAVQDGTGFGIIERPMMGADSLAAGAAEKSTTLSIQPGENDLPYSVTVTYFIR